MTDMDIAFGLLEASHQLAKRRFWCQRDKGRRAYLNKRAKIRRGTWVEPVRLPYEAKPKAPLHRESYICMTETEGASKRWRVLLAGQKFQDHPRAF